MAARANCRCFASSRRVTMYANLLTYKATYVWDQILKYDIERFGA